MVRSADQNETITIGSYKLTQNKITVVKKNIPMTCILYIIIQLPNTSDPYPYPQKPTTLTAGKGIEGWG